MKIKQTITAVVPARNEEKNIARCITALKWCDKIVVLSMSNDQTAAISRNLGAKVIKMKNQIKESFIAVQKNINFVIDHAATDWILRIDADEVVTPELKREIISVINQRTNCVAYGIPRSQYFLGGFLKGGDWAYDRLVRLFRPKYALYKPLVAVHEQFKVKGKICYLNNRLLHYSHPTVKDVIHKFQLYTDFEVLQIQETKLTAFFKTIYMPPYVFLRWTFWHLGIKDGVRGIVAGLFRAWYEFLLWKKFLKKIK